MCAAAAAAIPPDEEEPSISRFQSLIANTVSAGRRFRSLLPKPSGFRPTRSVAADGGDMWVRSRATREELKDIVAAATSKGVPEPIMTQFFISRAWLWAQWRSTIVSAVLPREVLYNICLGTAALLFLYAPGPSAAWRQGLVPALDGVHQVWLIASSIVTFTISFFLSQAYAVWRQVYSISRRVQGRLNDLGLLCAASAARDENGNFTPTSLRLLETISRYIRLFNVLLYASVSTRFAPLLTPAGLELLVESGELTGEERELLLNLGISHNTVTTWLWAACSNGLQDGRLPGAGAAAAHFRAVDGPQREEVATTSSKGSKDSSKRAGKVQSWFDTRGPLAKTQTALRPPSPPPADEYGREDSADSPPVPPAPIPQYKAAPTVIQLVFEEKFLELRRTYAMIADDLSGRMPLAYTQLVQILVDMLVISTPFALIPVLGTYGVLIGTAVITFFYSSVLNLAKVFLDPFDNES